MRLFGHELSTSWVLLIIVVAYWVFSGIGAWWLRRHRTSERQQVAQRRRPKVVDAQKSLQRPSMSPSKDEREDRLPDNVQARARAWKRWNETPRDASDVKRIVTATSLWGVPEKSAPFPKRFHASQLGKATLGRDLYDEMLGTPMDVDDPVQILSPRTWADLCLDVWALHSRSGQRPRLMRVWLNQQRALVEIHRGKTVTVDDILPDEVVGFVRGFTRLGPRKGHVDGLRWLSRGSVSIGSRPLWRTYKRLTELGAVAPEGSPLGDALRAADFHVLAITCMRYDSAWTENFAELRVLDAGGMTYQVGHAYRKESGADRWQPPSGEALAGEWEPPNGPPLVPGMWDEAGEDQVDRVDCAGVMSGGEDAVNAGTAMDGAGHGAREASDDFRDEAGAAREAEGVAGGARDEAGAAREGEETEESDGSEAEDRSGGLVDLVGGEAESEAMALGEGDGTADRAGGELPDGACAPVVLTDLPVVPIDPKAVLWAVEKMLEL